MGLSRVILILNDNHHHITTSLIISHSAGDGFIMENLCNQDTFTRKKERAPEQTKSRLTLKTTDLFNLLVPSLLHFWNMRRYIKGNHLVLPWR